MKFWKPWGFYFFGRELPFAWEVRAARPTFVRNPRVKTKYQARNSRVRKYQFGDGEERFFYILKINMICQLTITAAFI